MDLKARDLIFKFFLAVLTCYQFACANLQFNNQFYGRPPQAVFNNLLSPIIPRSECFTSADNRAGLCMPRTACTATGGIVAGNCGLLMACCIYQGSCRSVISANESYFVSPNYPSLQSERLNPSMCIFTLQHFDEFSLAPPRNGTCGFQTDSFVISGVSNFNASGLPANGLCGDLTGHHFYIDVDPLDVTEPLLLVVNTANEELFNRKWSIKIQQIACQSPFRAPTGCLQYYTTTSGTVESMNFRGATRPRPYINPTGFANLGLTQSSNYFHGMNYGICIAQAPKMCGIKWLANDFDFGGFRASLSGVGYPNPAVDGSGCVLARNTMVDGGDYIVIPSGSANGLASTHDRFCGQRLSPVDGSTVNNAIVLFSGPRNQRGFQLKWEQIACG